MDYSYPLRVGANKFPDRVALVYGRHELTYRELDRLVDALAAGFLRVGAADAPVASVALNEPSTVALYLALARAGIVGVPINPRLLVEEKAYLLRDSGASTLVVDSSYRPDAEALRDLVESLERVLVVGENLDELIDDDDAVAAAVDGESVATILYTSGTTGFPKGVMRTHAANLWNALNAASAIHRDPDDVELFNLPAFGVGFVQWVLPTLLSGGRVVLDRVFDPVRAWELLERHRVTRTFLAPTMIDSMLAVDGHERYDVSSLQTLGVAYEFPERVRERALARFGGRVFVNMYGLTEAQLTCTRPGEFAGDPTNVGKPMGLIRIRIVDPNGRELPVGAVGEITLEGPTLMAGYHGLEEATGESLRDGWLFTGDLGYLDAERNLHFAGRLKEIIKSGGSTVDPVEVENVVLAIPDLLEAAVVGAPHEHWGEMVVTFVVGGGVSEDDVIAHCRDRLADYKVPKRVFVLPELPKNATGKIERGRLRQVAAELLAR
jgi:acyl-CoA synthetase (AMP-forming)/AMP-acid ligase II